MVIHTIKRIATVITLASLISSPVSAQCYHWLFGGTVLYSDGQEQEFNGLRCFYSGRLYWNRDIDVLKRDYKQSTSVDLEQVTRIDLEGPTTDVGIRRGIRKGTVTLRGGDQLKSVYLYVGECEWAKYVSDKFTCDDEATLKGPLSEDGIRALVISRTPKDTSK